MDYRALFQKLSKFDTPTICNALQEFDNNRFALQHYGKPGLALRSKCDKIIVGFAVTATISSIDPPTAQQKALRFELYKATSAVQYPTVICIKDTDPQPIGSFWGEMQASIFKALGSEGTITDGGVRDLDSSDKLDFPFFSTCTLVSHANIHVTGVQIPVSICGQIVKPNDIIHADKHGFVIIPEEYLEKMALVCEKLAQAESLLLDPCQKAIKEGTRPSAEEIFEWYNACNKAKSEIRASIT